MADECAFFPAERVEQGRYLWQVIPEVVGGVGRAVGAVPLAAEVEGHDAASGQAGGQFAEAVGMVHPAMGGEERAAVNRTPCEARVAQPVEGPAMLLR